MLAFSRGFNASKWFKGPKRNLNSIACSTGVDVWGLECAPGWHDTRDLGTAPPGARSNSGTAHRTQIRHAISTEWLRLVCISDRSCGSGYVAFVTRSRKWSAGVISLLPPLAPGTEIRDMWKDRLCQTAHHVNLLASDVWCTDLLIRTIDLAWRLHVSLAWVHRPFVQPTPCIFVAGDPAPADRVFSAVDSRTHWLFSAVTFQTLGFTSRNKRPGDWSTSWQAT